MPKPVARYDIASADWFESKEKSLVEDRRRSRALNRQAAKHGGAWGKRAKALSRRLDPLQQVGRLPLSMASSRYMRKLRRRVTGALLQLIRGAGGATIRRADVVKASWACDVEELSRESLARLKNEFRSDLIRAGANRSKGFIVAIFHTEFDASANLFQHHFHLLVSEEQVDVVDRLRQQRGYASPRRKGAHDGNVATPVRIRREPITNAAYALSYLLKSFALEFKREKAGSGTRKDRKSGRRIREPYHSELLLWLDRQSVGDAVLLLGLRIGKNGFQMR